MRETGIKRKFMGKADTLSRVALFTLENGRMISSTDREKRLGQINLTTRVTLLMAKSMERVNTYGQITLLSVVISLTMLYVDMASTPGQMVRSMTGNGQEVKSMEKEFSTRVMAKHEKVFGKMTNELNGSNENH